MKRSATFVAAAAVLLLLASCNTTPGGGGGPTTSTVNGTLVGILDTPVAGASVTIGSTTVTSDAAGAFSIDNVTPPYDVTVSSTADNWAHVFVGLTSTSPVLLPYGAVANSSPPSSTATMGGTITTATPIDSTHPVEVCLEGVSETVFGCDTLTSSATYTINADWASTANVAVRVHALQMTLPSSGAMPNGYAGYAVSSSSTTMVPGTSYSRNLTLGAAPGVAAISGTITAPSSVTSGGMSLFVRLSPQLLIPLGDLNLTGTSTSYAATVPAFTGGSYTLLAMGVGSNITSARWSTGLTAGSGRDLAVAAAPTVASPPASAGPGDTFTVGNTGGAPLTVIFYPASASTGPVLAVTTSQSSVTMPSTLPVASGTAYDWMPIINPGESLDQVSGDWLSGLYLLLSSFGPYSLDTNGSFATLAIFGTPPSFTVP